ncbi:hypothetical protein [Specibacter sp. RAF43]|uniref:hypothetical protein n=1 Tax=Specibacter sp. RAF43 TaxID=3233057 RepID=UPI003F9A464D
MTNALQALTTICEATAVYAGLTAISAAIVQGTPTWQPYPQWIVAGLIASAVLGAMWLARIMAGQPAPDYTAPHRTWHRAAVLAAGVIPAAVVVSIVTGGGLLGVMMPVASMFALTVVLGLIVEIPVVRKALAAANAEVAK